MLGLNKGLADILLKQIKTQIKSQRIQYIAVIPDENGDLDTRAFKNKMYLISPEMLEKIKENPELSEMAVLIEQINNPKK